MKRLTGNGKFSVQFKDYHLEIVKQLFQENGTPETISTLFTELEVKLKKAPSFDFNYEYDQIICFGELVSTQIVSDYLNYSGILNQWIDVRNCLKTDDLFRDATVDWEWTEELVTETFQFDNIQVICNTGIYRVNLSKPFYNAGA